MMNLVEPASPMREYVHNIVFDNMPLDETCLLKTGSISASTGKESSNIGCLDSAKHCTISPDLERNINEPFLKLIASLIAEAPKKHKLLFTHLFLKIQMKTNHTIFHYKFFVIISFHFDGYMISTPVH